MISIGNKVRIFVFLATLSTVSKSIQILMNTNFNDPKISIGMVAKYVRPGYYSYWTFRNMTMLVVIPFGHAQTQQSYLYPTQALHVQSNIMVGQIFIISQSDKVSYKLSVSFYQPGGQILGQVQIQIDQKVVLTLAYNKSLNSTLITHEVEFQVGQGHHQLTISGKYFTHGYKVMDSFKIVRVSIERFKFSRGKGKNSIYVGEGKQVDFIDGKINRHHDNHNNKSNLQSS